MLIVKVLFFRQDKAPVTLDSKRISIPYHTTIDEINSLAENFLKEFIVKYPEMKNIDNLGRQFTLQG